MAAPKGKVFKQYSETREETFSTAHLIMQYFIIRWAVETFSTAHLIIKYCIILITQWLGIGQSDPLASAGENFPANKLLGPKIYQN